MKRLLAVWALLLCFVITLSACTMDGSGIPSVPWEVPNMTTPPTIPVPDGSSFQVHFIDVGQADSALIICDGKAMLIDGGNRGDSDLIYSYLKQNGISHLEYLIGTHGHEDHVGGLAAGLQYATCDTVFCSVTDYDSKAFENFANAAKERGCPIEVPEAGYTFNLGSAVCQIVGPVRDYEDPNDTSIVLRVAYGETSFLFTGDAETPSENDILDAGYTIDCDVLKVGHHGASTSTGYRWLREASPEYAIISVGTDNDYGHPTEATLSKLRDADVVTYRTDMHGTVICTSDGKDLSFLTTKNPSGSPLDGAGAGGNHTEVSKPTDDKNSSEGSQNGSGKVAIYILNTSSGKFHLPQCDSVTKMSEKNKKEVRCTREKMIEDGYSPCGYCDP